MSWKDEAKMMRVPVDEVPAGWKTTAQIADEGGWALSTARKIVLETLRAGRAEHRTFRIRTGTRVYAVPHYRLRKS